MLILLFVAVVNIGYPEALQPHHEVVFELKGLFYIDKQLLEGQIVSNFNQTPVLAFVLHANVDIEKPLVVLVLPADV